MRRIVRMHVLLGNAQTNTRGTKILLTNNSFAILDWMGEEITKESQRGDGDKGINQTMDVQRKPRKSASIVDIEGECEEVADNLQTNPVGQENQGVNTPKQYNEGRQVLRVQET